MYIWKTHIDRIDCGERRVQEIPVVNKCILHGELIREK